MAGRIIAVQKGSIGERSGVKPGDKLISVNGTDLVDILDYHVLTDSGSLELMVERDSSTLKLNIRKNPEEPLGLRFETSLFDGVRRCRNRCIFCFVDQLPRGVRPALKVKDDDYRLSFLYGNFITLTNLTDGDIARIVELRISPLYISLHTTDGELHGNMLRPLGPDKALERLDELLTNGIGAHIQIVLCPGYNDGERLEETLSELERRPGILSVGIVPVGLSGHRKGLTELRAVSEEETAALIERIERVQTKMLEERGEPWVYLADEFYATLGRELPEAALYADFPQVENGIGIARLFLDGAEEALADLSEQTVASHRGSYLAVTGMLAAEYIRRTFDRIKARTGIHIDVLPVANDFLGEQVTVAGLVAGRDIETALKECARRATVLLPDVMINDDGLFVDDWTPSDIEKTTGCDVRVVPSDGRAFIEWLARAESE